MLIMNKLINFYYENILQNSFLKHSRLINSSRISIPFINRTHGFSISLFISKQH